MMFTPGEVETDAIAAASVLHFDSISLASENPRACSLFAVDRAREAGHLITYDVNLRLPLWPDADSARAGILTGLAKAQVVKLSDDELEFMTGSREPGAVRRLWHDGLKLLTLSRGSAGSTWFTATDQRDVPTHAVPAVDTTGAGDGFMAGLIAGMLDDPDAVAAPDKLDRICGFANAVGALTTLERGAIPALPTRAAVERFLESR
jgi:fructokinase